MATTRQVPPWLTPGKKKKLSFILTFYRTDNLLLTELKKITVEALI